jgi:hypothetical protein
VIVQISDSTVSEQRLCCDILLVIRELPIVVIRIRPEHPAITCSDHVRRHYSHTLHFVQLREKPGKRFRVLSTRKHPNQGLWPLRKSSWCSYEMRGIIKQSKGRCWIKWRKSQSAVVEGDLESRGGTFGFLFPNQVKNPSVNIWGFRALNLGSLSRCLRQP